MKEIDGIVVKVTEKQIVLLCNNGTFKNIPRSKNQFPLMGEKIPYREKTRVYKPMGWMAIASIACLLFLMFTMVPIKTAEAAYIVAFDINPSIEVYLDEDLKGMSMMTLNSEGGNIISKIDYKGQDLPSIVKSIIDQCVKQRYLSSNGDCLVSTTIIPTHHGGKLTQSQLESFIQSSLKQHKITAAVNVNVGSKEQIKNAHELNLSVNKYHLYKDFAEKGISVELGEVQSTPINKLVEKEKKKDQSVKKPPKNNKQSNNNQSNNNSNKDKQNLGQTKTDQNKPNQTNKGQNNQGQNNKNK